MTVPCGNATSTLEGQLFWEDSRITSRAVSNLQYQFSINVGRCCWFHSLWAKGHHSFQIQAHTHTYTHTHTHTETPLNNLNFTSNFSNVLTLVFRPTDYLTDLCILPSIQSFFRFAYKSKRGRKKRICHESTGRKQVRLWGLHSLHQSYSALPSSMEAATDNM